jgi:predicted permease
MRLFARLRSYAQSLFHRRQLEADLNDELRDHLEREIESNIRAGMTREDARNAAHRLIGPIVQFQEECRDARGMVLVENIARDLAYGLRSLRRNPGGSFIAIAALAVGIGSSAAIYSLARTVVIAPLPFPQADRLVQIQMASRKTGELADWAPLFDVSEWRGRNRTFDEIAGYTFALLDLPSDPPAALYGARITQNLFPALGVSPALGRNFLPEEDQPGRGQAIILSDSLWKTRFRANPNIIGKTIRLAGQPESEEYIVVGVMPAGFNFPLTIPTAVNPPTRQMAYWLPLAQDSLQRDQPTFVIPIGLVRSGLPMATAQNDLSAVAAALEREYPDTNEGRMVRVSPLQDQLLGRAKLGLILLLAAIGAVLLIVCVNLANLLLSRVLSRSRESGVRLALGASRLRLLQQWLAESLLVAGLGGLGAIAVAKIALQKLLQIAPQAIPRVAGTWIDAGVFAFIGIVAAVVGLVVGCLPALAAAKTGLQTALQGSGTRLTAHVGKARARDLLIIAEVSLAVVLALGASLMAKSFLRLTGVDPGFSRNHVSMSLIILVNRNYPDLLSRVRFMHQLLDILKRAPGVISAGAVDGTPLSGNITGSFVHPEGVSAPQRGYDRLSAEVFSASPDYLYTIGIRLLRGRCWNEHEAANDNPVAVINRTAAEAFWPHEDPLGKRISFEVGNSKLVERNVIGIVGDTRDANIDQPARPALYVPMEQGPSPPQMVVVRTANEVSGPTSAAIIRHAVTAVDKTQPVFLVTSMDDLYDNSIADRRFTTFILSLLGAVALGLSALGVYGVVAYAVAQRTREIGIRTALGAQPSEIIWLVLGHSLRLSTAGTAIGLCAGLASTRYLSTLLYDVVPNDLSTIATVVLIFTGTTLLAAFLPSYRAVRIDSVKALRDG